MFVFKSYNVIFVLIFHVSDCQRRIKGGEVVADGKKYVVYLLKAPISPQYYDAWLCGGALVSAEYIVTSAACVTDVKHLYAIAGYNKYVSDEEINNDPCTKEKKKKIILTCTPKAYELKYEELEKWSFIDIAVVKVESPYDLTDETFASVCSYIPVPIQINYEMKYQEPGVDAIVFGWGHLDKWRSQGDPTNYNQEIINYAPTLIQEKEQCKKEYEVYNGMEDVIDRYMICTFEKGNLDAAGETIVTSAPTAQGCSMQQKKLKGYEGVSCENANKPGEEIVLIENSRKDNDQHSNKTRNNSDQKHNHSLNDEIYRNVVDSNTTHNYSLIDKIYKNVMNSNRRVRTRRQGICQNDHGGPLVTWVGNHEVLIGVASVFKITEDFDCVGPYLYASTQCNGAFLDCILRSDPGKDDKIRRSICDAPPKEKGFELIEKHISWIDHPDGPADNERNITTTNIPKTLTENLTRTAKDGKIEEKKLYNYTSNLIKSTILNEIINFRATNKNYTTNSTKVTTTIQETKSTNRNPTRTTFFLNNTTSANLTNIGRTGLNKTTISILMRSTTSKFNLLNTTTVNTTTTQRNVTS